MSDAPVDIVGRTTDPGYIRLLTCSRARYASVSSRDGRVTELNGIGKIIDPIGLAMIVGSSNIVKPDVTIAAILPSFIYLAAWSALAGIAYAFIRKDEAAANPWGVGATTLEWTLPSPPPFHQYESLPLIR